MDDFRLLIDLHRPSQRQGPGGDAETKRAMEMAGLDRRFRPGGGQQDRKQVHQDEPACTAARQAMDIPNFHLQDPFASSDSSACCTVSLPQHALSVFVLCLEIMIKRVKHLRESQCFFSREKA